ncbi:glycosyltransferase family 4 protein [bacterium]|nr:glycosyltransferase family 4 protein [bacterium]
MDKKLKTLHVDSEMSWGGGQRQVSGLCTYLRDWGHDVKLVCRPGSKLQKWADENGFASFPVEMKSILSVSAVLSIRSIIARERPDIVHMHSSRAHVLGSAAARLAGIGIALATRRNDDIVKMLWPNTDAYGRWTKAIIAISDSVHYKLVLSGVEPSKIRVIQSGTDVDRFEHAVGDPNLRERLGIDPSAFIICCAASLAECKGIRYLIEAASLVKRKVHLIIAGDGEQRDMLEALTRDKGVSASFTGFCSDMPGLLAVTDAFVMPSLAEGLGVAALEAMAAGKPVIASAVGGLRESVQDCVTGYLVPPADPKSLADAIDKLIDDPEQARRFGEAGRARVRENFSLENMAHKNESLYYELLGM